jgi:hypothetical protein
MRLGSETGSVINNLCSRAVIGEPRPKVGMGATMLLWTDRNAGTISKVEEVTSKRYQYLIEVQEDLATVVAGSTQDGSADYEYSPRPDALPYLFAKVRDSGFWIMVRRNESGRLVKAGGRGLRIGERETYRDPSF